MPFELLPALTVTAILASSAGGFVWFLSACRRAS